MRNLFVLLLSLLAVAPALATPTDYNSLWKQVDAVAGKDQPRTVIGVLDKIIAGARRERSYGQLLAAETRRASVYYSISPDSLDPALARLKNEARTARGEALKAVYNAVVGKVYKQTDGKDSAKVYFAMALAAPDALAHTQAGDYQPLLLKGNDSGVFGNDLLHVIAMEAGNYSLLTRYYDSCGNGDASLAAAVMGADRDYELGTDEAIAKLDSIGAAHKGSKEAWRVAYAKEEYYADKPTEEHVRFIDEALKEFPVSQYPAMVRLQNSRNRMTTPSFRIEGSSDIWTPTAQHTLKLVNITNVDDIRVEITRLKTDGKFSFDESNLKAALALRSGEPVFTATRTYSGKKDYETFADSVVVPQLPVGVYLVKAYAPNRKADPAYATFYVSNLMLLAERVDNGSLTRLAVVNATTGRPVAKARIDLMRRVGWGSKRHAQTLYTGSDGEAKLTTEKNYSQWMAYVTTSDDKYLPNRPLYFYYSFAKPSDASHVRLFTDRSIYRPGQRLNVALIAWNTQNGTEANAEAGRQMTITLRDANYKVAGEKTVTTDNIGAANAFFDLPAEGLSGRFTISTSNPYGSTSVRVEEYKRPTFHIAFDEYKEQYNIGDTVKLTATATTYSGLPVQNAKVEYTVKRTQAFWWWNRGGNDDDQLLTSTATTDEQGRFTVLMPMQLPANVNRRTPMFYRISATAKVTSLSGESHEETASLPVGTRASVLTSDLPQMSLADSLKAITFTRVNMAGKPIAGEVDYTIDGQARKAQANQKIALPMLKSGKHSLVAVCGQDTLRQEVVVFSLGDKRPVITTEDWFYQTSDEVSREHPAYIQVGSSEQDQHVFYTIFDGNKTIESGSFDVSNSINTRKFTDKYDGNLSLNYVWVRNGHVYVHSTAIKKKLPDNHLRMKWTTFRDRLSPGQKETWTLSILRPDGKPARASLISTLYDKSLDQIVAHNWTFSTDLGRSTCMAQWTKLDDNMIYNGFRATTSLAEGPELNYWRFDPENFLFYRVVSVMSMMRMKNSARPAKSEIEMALAGSTRGMTVLTVMSPEENMAVADSVADAPEEEAEAQDGGVRTNFSETAFFMPDSRTDADGNVTLSFTLPESVTTWRYMGLAHDSLMNYGQITSEVVAQKKLMVQPNLPRFLRQGDRATISTTVANTSDAAMDTRVSLRLTNAATDSVVYTATKQVTVASGATEAVSFSFDTSRFPEMLVCKVQAASADYSDGEQHYLPVLSPYERVIDTHPFTINGSGSKEFDLSQLKGKQPRLTLEYTANPSLLVLSALHSVATTNEKNAISLVTSIYANRLGSYILGLNPQMKKYAELWVMEPGQQSLKGNLQKNDDLKTFSLGETPWVQEAEDEEAQKRALVYFYDDNTIGGRLSTANAQLKKLQNADGSFSWWPGMRGSTYMTQAVCRTLVRLHAVTGDNDADMSAMISSAFGFLDKQMAEEVTALKREQRKHGAKGLCPSDLSCDYLYASALYGRKATADMTYLVGLLAKMPTRLTIYGKANSAIILNYFGHKQQAREYLRSLREYTVYRDETGRYFDTPRAYYSWQDYRIPTQTAAIEALKLLAPADTVTVEQMQYWLLQEKRTTQWTTPINTADAVYAFLDKGHNTANASGTATVLVDGQPVSLPSAAAGSGYFRMDLPQSAGKVEVRKSGKGTSWGALYAQYTDRSSAIGTASSGISVTRRVEGAANAKVGDKVKVVLTIKADRDYDFVAVADNRAACLEPADRLSGYNGRCYEETLDRSTCYFFDRLPKGTWQVSTDYFIDREGNYHSGTATVQCAYAPEFSGRYKAENIEVKRKE